MHLGGIRSKELKFLSQQGRDAQSTADHSPLWSVTAGSSVRSRSYPPLSIVAHSPSPVNGSLWAPSHVYLKAIGNGSKLTWHQPMVEAFVRRPNLELFGF